MFETLFKFDPLNFTEGSIGFQVGPWAWTIGLFLFLCLAGFAAVYFLTDRFTSDRSRALSLGLRVTALLLLCLPLFEPVLITPDVVPDENFVAVLVDGSESMNVPDGAEEQTRLDEARSLLAGETALLEGLEEHFKVRTYLFGEDATRVDSVGGGAASDHGTNLAAALDRVIADFKGVPLAGVVLFTDGSDNSSEVPLSRAETLRDLGVPLHVVGMGQETAASERELLDVTVSRGVEKTTGAEIDVKVRSWRPEPEPVAFNLYRGDDLVFTQSKPLKGEGRIDQFTLFYEPDATGADEYELRVAEAPGERNTENNALNALIDTRSDTLRILYVEGHLRRDFKFAKRSLEDDHAVRFTSITRTGTGKYYRQGIQRPDELAGGFPATEEELFTYDVVLFGDVEASNFSIDQLRMVEKFVRLRGGGFAMVGGRMAFAEGNYWNSPIADVLPVELDPARRSAIPPSFTQEDAAAAEQGYRLRPTAAGRESSILKFASDPDESALRWTTMPGLTSINYLGAVKPGAVILAEKPDDEFGGSEPLLTTQRYGKGRSAALATASTWRWQMLLDAEDMRHERFWRQFVRWLAASAPGRVHLDMERSRFAPLDEVPLAVNVYDETYAPLDDAAVFGRVIDPFGTTRELMFQPDLTSPGTYTTTLIPQDEGIYEVEVSAEAAERRIGEHVQSFLVRPSKREYHDAVLQRDFLENLASANGGWYYEPSRAGTISEQMRSRRTSTSIYHVSYLWDMPFLFGIILLVLSAEWIYRRRKGLP